MIVVSWPDLRKFADRCERLKLTVPAPLARGLELADAARRAAEDEPARLLDMSVEELVDRITTAAVRQHAGRSKGAGDGLAPGVDETLVELGREVREATIPELEGLVRELQPRFEAAAEPFVDVARRFGFTYATTSDDVILHPDRGAVDAWRRVRSAWYDLVPFTQFRIEMTRLFEVAPTTRDLREATPPTLSRRGAYLPDYSVMFAAGDNWDTEGAYYTEPDARQHIDWLSLAQGGLRLNTPREVQQKIRERVTKRRAALTNRPPVPAVSVIPPGAAVLGRR